MILGDLADVVRSKNAGIHYVTVDVVFDDPATYEAVRDARVLTTEAVAEAYGIDPDDVDLFEYDAGKAFKITIPRGRPAGSPGDPDLYGAQQHVPVRELSVEGVSTDAIDDREVD